MELCSWSSGDGARCARSISATRAAEPVRIRVSPPDDMNMNTCLIYITYIYHLYISLIDAGRRSIECETPPNDERNRCNGPGCSRGSARHTSRRTCSRSRIGCPCTGGRASARLPRGIGSSWCVLGFFGVMASCCSRCSCWSGIGDVFRV